MKRKTERLEEEWRRVDEKMNRGKGELLWKIESELQKARENANRRRKHEKGGE